MSTKYTVKDLDQLRKRLEKGKLGKEDIALLDELIVGHIELRKSIESAHEKVGDKSVLAKLPFGVDIVK